MRVLKSTQLKHSSRIIINRDRLIRTIRIRIRDQDRRTIRIFRFSHIRRIIRIIRDLDMIDMMEEADIGITINE